MKYYEVLAKCGHVRRNFYIIKSFYVMADSKSEAAYIVRWTKRVKHHHKDAIREVREISLQDYRLGKIKNSKDLYFKSKSIQEQRKLHAVDPEEIIAEAITVNYKKKHKGQFLRHNVAIKEFDTLKQGGYIYDYE